MLLAFLSYDGPLVRRRTSAVPKCLASGGRHTKRQQSSFNRGVANLLYSFHRLRRFSSLAQATSGSKGDSGDSAEIMKKYVEILTVFEEIRNMSSLFPGPNSFSFGQHRGNCHERAPPRHSQPHSHWREVPSKE